MSDRNYANQYGIRWMKYEKWLADQQRKQSLIKK